MAYARPLPDITAESRPFWDACRRHELRIQRCRRCGELQHYPRGICSRCWGDDLEWRVASGRGTVWTFTVTHRTQARGFRDELPYVVAWVELEEGVLVLSNVVEVAPARVAIGMPVRVVFEDVTPEISIPRFAPVERA